MDPVLAGTLLVALAREAPDLVAKVIATLHKQGHITTDEVISFLNTLKGESGASFFPSLPKAPTP